MSGSYCPFCGYENEFAHKGDRYILRCRSCPELRYPKGFDRTLKERLEKKAEERWKLASYLQGNRSKYPNGLELDQEKYDDLIVKAGGPWDSET